ncbi:TetR/AcrR family transcriptional regulator [Cellulomonas marina]|uniref:DNA-binding transcriptional regulator, AcrR family n=1 Tax=Cellulomonas marina TaxID=988821 RepID=A0A1I0X7D0_9CELL|nr:TetR/AcrR family transcriptional regulator C-terminal domain-containing protein [Cellulomonas marina]GIG29491.1 TetR family transcriptional regulator [Cellulomonas marina]SFA96949.1 DNA-binding transcriptional regulator, AcrR family [Cellulomonas marina]
MAAGTGEPRGTGRRPALTRDRVLAAALALADADGIEPLTIRRLAAALDVKPMTLYHHVPGKEAILDGLVDLVFAEVEDPPTDVGWREALRVRCHALRAVLRRHPWAVPLLETRTTPGPATLRHHDAVLGTLRRGGLSLPLTAHAYAVLDSYVYGFALQEATLPVHDDADLPALAEAIVGGLPPGAFPHLVELTTQHVLQPGYAFGDSFAFGLDVLLDGIEEAAAREA